MSQKQIVENQEQATSLLVQAVQLAQKRGAYDLHEAGLLSQAISFLVSPAPAEEEVEKETTEED